jgi:hypothetical protein
MSLLNLTLAQFLGLLGAGSALLIVLYLLDRSRRRQRVSTLRFWVEANRAPETRRRRRIQQWPSLLLQWLALALLLAALGDLRVGSRGQASRDHILVLDTSAWMGARAADRTLMVEARELARAWLRRLPAGDRVMLVRADALTTPATPFTEDRALLEEAIARSQPSATALRLGRALAFADRLRRSGGNAGEIVFIGSGRIAPEELAQPARIPDGLRFLEVRGEMDNCGLRHVVLRRDPQDPSLWRILARVRNYGRRPQFRRLRLAFGGSPAGEAVLSLPPDSEHEAAFSLRTQAAGWLELRLSGRDALADDDAAVLELPALRPIRLLAYTRQPESLRPLLATNPWVRVEFRPPEAYDPVAAADVVLLDQFCPPELPRIHSVWLDPPADRAPAAVRRSVSQARLSRWRTEHPVAAGLRTRDLWLASARVLTPAQDDVPIAEVDAGPVILARAGRPKAVIFGFQPLATAMRYEVALPLLFANMLRWMAPEAFGLQEVLAHSAGSLTLELGEDGGGEVRVVTDGDHSLPFTLERNRLELFTSSPQQVRVLTSAGERVVSFALPELAQARWSPPAGVRRGLPPLRAQSSPRLGLWPWLALAAGACLWLEGRLYGRFRPAAAHGPTRLSWRAISGWLRRTGVARS